MSSAPSPTPPAPPRPKDPDSITIISHSQLVYWWPVWAFGFIFGLWTYLQGTLMVVVPPKTEAHDKASITNLGDRAAFVLPADAPKVANTEFQLPRDPSDKNKPDQPHLHMTSTKGMGVLYAVILLLVIVITNVPLRGLWSVIAIVGIILLALIFQLAGWWDEILRYFSFLDIRINMGGYFFIATVLFVAWLVTITVFDRQIYIVFTPGQLKVCTEIGGGEKVYDAFGLHLEKQRSDLFRHWILGLGSGDLIVKTSGASSAHFDLPNVLFIGRKVAMIENLMKKKMVDVKD